MHWYDVNKFSDEIMYVAHSSAQLHISDDEM